MRTRGRPVKDEKRSHVFSMRLGEDELCMIDEMSLKSGKTKVEIVREAIKHFYKIYKYL